MTSKVERKSDIAELVNKETGLTNSANPDCSEAQNDIFRQTFDIFPNMTLASCNMINLGHFTSFLNNQRCNRVNEIMS